VKKLLALFFLAPFCALAQPFIIKGTVIGEDQKPIYGANVGLFNPRDSSVMRGTTTNEKGEYTLERGRPGPFLLKVTYLGYSDKMQSGFIQESPVMVPPIVLQKTGKNLQGVNINTRCWLPDLPLASDDLRAVVEPYLKSVLKTATCIFPALIRFLREQERLRPQDGFYLPS
jgi:hypothetical protein